MLCVLSHSVVSNSLGPHGLKLTRLLPPWNSAGKNTGVSCHSLLQGIFPIQGLNLGLLGLLGLLHWQADSLPLAPPGKPLLPSRGHKILLQSLKNSEFSNNIFFISRFSSQCLSTHYLGWFFFPQVEYLYPYS